MNLWVEHLTCPAFYLYDSSPLEMNEGISKKRGTAEHLQISA